MSMMVVFSEAGVESVRAYGPFQGVACSEHVLTAMEEGAARPIAVKRNGRWEMCDGRMTAPASRSFPSCWPSPTSSPPGSSACCTASSDVTRERPLADAELDTASDRASRGGPSRCKRGKGLRARQRPGRTQRHHVGRLIGRRKLFLVAVAAKARHSATMWAGRGRRGGRRS